MCVIVMILISCIGIYKLAKNHLPQFVLKDDETIKLEYDYIAINVNKEGTYNVKDSSGNTTTKELKVNITQAPVQNQELGSENVEGKKTIHNTLKDKTVVSEKTNSVARANNSFQSQPQKSSASSNDSQIPQQTQPVK